MNLVKDHLAAQPADPDGDQDREDQLGELVRRHRPMLLAYTGRLTGGDRDWAEDVTQETFVRAWLHLDRLTAGRGAVHGWLRRVAHNLVMDGYRSARSRPREVELDGCAQPEMDDSTEHVVTSVLLQDALAGLPDEHRVALVETYLNDRTASQAAVRLGIPVGTVKSRVFYGLRRLRASVDTTALAG